MQGAVRRRGVEYILHFTRVENLSSILREGIVPRRALEMTGRRAVLNDHLRLDGCKDASCFSIGHPNYKMFWSLRSQDSDSEWVVIACGAEILWRMDCAFCVENAAKNTVTAVPIGARKGVAAFEAMFAQVVDKPTRSELRLADNTPTNPQAEVLVFGTVPPDMILGVLCPSKGMAGSLSLEYPGVEFAHVPWVFQPRHDFENWR